MAVPGGEIVATCSNFQRDVLWGKVLISGLFVSRRKVRGGSVARWEIAATVGNRSEILFPGSSCPRDLTYPGEEKKRSFRNNNLSLPRETLSLSNSIFPALPPLILSRSLFSPKSSNRSNSFVPRVVRPLRPRDYHSSPKRVRRLCERQRPTKLSSSNSNSMPISFSF